MSESIEELAKHYKKNVFQPEHPRSIGLFTIPEYPELEADRGMWSAALDAILTSLRYLAPATLLTLFWGQQSFLFKILKHIDSAFRAIVFSSEEQKQAVLQWLAEAGPVRVEHLDTVWRHGWIVCGVLDAALPGACAGHPPTRLSLKHAQAIADHYLGVEPVFSRQELESDDSLSRHQEWKLATYLDRIREALSKLTPPVSKPVSQRTSPESTTTQFTLDYVAKGSGLSAVQVNNRAYFKIYPTAQQALEPGEITILIRGPKDTYGMAVIPPILGKAQMIRQKLLGLQSKQTYTENILPITQGATYLRSYGKNDMNKTYYIPKTKYDIDINVEFRTDHAKICYIVNIDGRYEVSITSRGQNIVGSPFAVTASNNIVSILERDNYCLENGEEIDIVDVKTDRKVVLRIVDFVTEKMLLRENGTLEKISDTEAQILMKSDKTENEIQNSDNESFSDAIKEEIKSPQTQSIKFNTVAHRVLMMNRVCKIFNDLMFNKQNISIKKEFKNLDRVHPRNPQDIPDIVNSTLTEINVASYVLPENRNKFIVPESIAVSLTTEKSKPLFDEEVHNAITELDNITINEPTVSTRIDSPNSLHIDSYEEQMDDNVSVDRMTPSSSNNPFLNDMYEANYVAEKNFGTFVTSEYETNNSQNEETRESSITIVIDPDVTPPPPSNNPFFDADVIDFDRPKTPVFKIISGDVLNRDESVFIDPKSKFESEDNFSNEFINPFFMHHHQTTHYEQAPVTDFIIGAPVSLPPIIRAPSPDPTMKSLIITNNENITSNTKENEDFQKTKVEDVSEFLTPLHKPLKTSKISNKGNNSNESSTFHSLDSIVTDNIDSNASTASNDNQFDTSHIASEQNLTPKKDMWDSAYVSIDDNNSSPDNNNNENTLSEMLSKQKFSPSDDDFGLKQEEISNMGPAEREIWQTCSELKSNSNKSQEEMKPHKWEVKRPIFTPILEESDRSISSGTKDLRSNITCIRQETETVSVAFAELNDIYQEYFPNSETSSTTLAYEDNELQSVEVECITQSKDMSVDSASVLSDVKRRAEELEGTTSEVQANVTESVSASQTLHKGEDIEYNEQDIDETQFGDNSYSNIVLEKKKYWDERIREIESKSAETPILQKKKRIASKQLKHNDSLSKRKGKQMIKNFLSVGDYSQVKSTIQVENKDIDMKTHESETQHSSMEKVKSDENLVEKWKKYWDHKLESEQKIIETMSPRHVTKKVTPELVKSSDQEVIKINHDVQEEISTAEQPPVKQELPEEVFKAFETSPKRFFGTSRKHILNKIDTFLGKPTTIDTSTTAVNNVCHESGLVSSRISLFHNMSNTEELPWARRKCQSLHNIYNRRESDKATCSSDEKNTSEQTKSPQEESKEQNNFIDNTTSTTVSEAISLKDKRARMLNNTLNRSFDETQCQMLVEEEDNTEISMQEIDKELNIGPGGIKTEVLRKKSFSKSEMDIFNKIPNETSDDYLDKYKSCDELPKINVKSFISLYESVSKSAVESKAKKRMYRTASTDSQKLLHTVSPTSDAAHRTNIRNRTDRRTNTSNSESQDSTPQVTPKKRWMNKDSESVSNASCDTRTSESIDIGVLSNDNRETTYFSLSDIELEIIESCPDKSSESSPEKTIDTAHIDYKSRFKSAKEYFQSLEELREMNVKKARKLNECELMLRKESTESLEDVRPQKSAKKNVKSHSLPSSEISKIWNQLQESQAGTSNTKLVKISEKFHVDDLFSDVTEGKLSRQGSLRGIPHKKAVLEAFRSMENIADSKINSYEIAESQLTDFAEEHRVQKAQTYLTEYPYLPTTDPSKYHSRIDANASGLISLKELKGQKPRRNSVPDLRLNPKFTEDL